ncbi:MAG: hypothetical protein U0R50_01100 [Gaiellales bacterium]
MSTVETARLEWAEGHRRFLETAAEPGLGRPSHEECQIVIAELRRTVGSTYSLDELSEAYQGAEIWAQRSLAEHATSPTWPRRVTNVVDAAFHVYSRGALDFAP